MFVSSSDDRRNTSAVRVLAVAIVALIATGLAVASDDAGQDLQQNSTIEISAPVTPYVFDGDLRDLPAPAGWKHGDPVKEIPRRFYPKPGIYDYREPQHVPDVLAERQQDAEIVSGADFTIPSRNFPGQGYSGVNPPDTVGDVGPDHYIQMINAGGGSQVRVYDKAEPTPNVLSTFALDSLGSGACASGFGDPIVLYDREAERWMLSEFSGSGNNLCIYVSQTPDPLSGGWFNYQFTAPSFPDYPKYGVWPTDANGGAGSYVATANDGGPGIYVFDRGKMLTGAAATYLRVVISNLPGFGFEAPTPADLDGANPPPSGSPAIIMRHRDTEAHSGPAAPGDLLEMWLYQVDWVTPGNSVLTIAPSIDVAEFDSSLCGLTSFNCFPQPGTGTQLDPLREVIMNRLQYRNQGEHESLVGNFVVDVNGANLGGLRWFELRKLPGGSWTLHQEGTYSPDNVNRFMAGSAMDQSGNIAIAYNVSSSTTFPSLRYTGRQADDELGVLTQAETVIHAGTASNSSNRYGDYSAMNVDPTDDCTFWFTGMDNTSSNWRTQIASFRFEACGCDLFPDALSVDAAVSGDNSIEITWNDATLDAVSEYRVLRSRNSGGPWTLIATIEDTSPGVAGGSGYVYEDTTVSGGIDYYYTVRASDGAACTSSPSNEVVVEATGSCLLAPIFFGIQSVTEPAFGICTLDLAWNPASAECGGQISYNIYRSTNSGFTPGPASLIASGLTSTAYSDFNALVDGTTYFYVVRAVDATNGIEDANFIKRSGTPQGQPSAPGESEALLAEGTTQTFTLGEFSRLTFVAGADESAAPARLRLSVDGGASWVPVAVTAPDGSLRAAGDLTVPEGGGAATWSADLSAWAGRDVRLRFTSSTDLGAAADWVIEQVHVTDVLLNEMCVTGSSCPDNPFVDVVPNGPTTLCYDDAPTLSASLSGGTSPFEFRWFEDGEEIVGETGSTYRPSALGEHRYNVKVRSTSCPDETFDGLDTVLTLQNAPVFGGIGAVVDPQNDACTLDVSWNAGSTVCDGPLTYFVYRDTDPGVTPTPDNLVASGIAGTSFSDAGALANGQTYHYLVRAFDLDTGNFDGNTQRLSAVPTGPGSGIQTPLNETFSSAATFADWTVTTGPGPHSCGEWALASAAGTRPNGGSGSYAWVNANCGALLPRTSTTLTSEPISGVFSGTILSMTLEYKLRFDHFDGGDTAKVEIYDGSNWITLWTDADVDVNQTFSFDVMAYAANNPNFRVRFDYQNGNADRGMSVDDVVLRTNVINPCLTSVGPTPTPDGTNGTAPLRGDKLTLTGDSIAVGWDTSSCTATGYNLLYGSLANLQSYALDGSECGLGASGSYTWTGVPAGDLWFVVVGTDGSGTESSWGANSYGGERNGVTPSGECSVVVKDLSGVCP